MAKLPLFSRFIALYSAFAWRISEPHISTFENLHANQKPVFSTMLRAFGAFFAFLQTLSFLSIDLSESGY